MPTPSTPVFYKLLQLAIRRNVYPSKCSFSSIQFRWTFPRKTIQKRRLFHA